MGRSTVVTFKGSPYLVVFLLYLSMNNRPLEQGKDEQTARYNDN